eukprot:6485099-Amphidinium_carterae.3
MSRFTASSTANQEMCSSSDTFLPLDPLAPHTHVNPLCIPFFGEQIFNGVLLEDQHPVMSSWKGNFPSFSALLPMHQQLVICGHHASCSSSMKGMAFLGQTTWRERLRGVESMREECRICTASCKWYGIPE